MSRQAPSDDNVLDSANLALMGSFEVEHGPGDAMSIGGDSLCQCMIYSFALFKLIMFKIQVLIQIAAC